MRIRRRELAPTSIPQSILKCQQKPQPITSTSRTDFTPLETVAHMVIG